MSDIMASGDQVSYALDSSGSDDSFGGEISDWLNDKDATPAKDSLCKENSFPSANDVGSGHSNTATFRTAADHNSGAQIVVQVPNSVYINAHLDEFSALCEVEDLNFHMKSIQEQETILQSMTTLTFRPGEYVFELGDTTDEFYIIVAGTNQHASAHVEVVRENRVITRLYRGQYFGQLQFLTRQPRARNASIRIPPALQSNVKIARISAEHFEHWTFFRTMLIVRAIPFLNQLPSCSRLELLSQTVVVHYSAGDCIIKQGDVGDCFYILLDGSVRIVEDLPGGRSEQLAILRAGHCFGEMALASNEPRVANVLSQDSCTCLMLTKDAFQKELSVNAFSEVLADLLQTRQRTRKHRDIVRKPYYSSSNNNSHCGSEWAEFAHVSVSADSESLSSEMGLPSLQSNINSNIIEFANKGWATDSFIEVADDENATPSALNRRSSAVSADINGNHRMSISDNAVVMAYRTPPARSTRRTLSEPLDVPVTETKYLSVSKLETGDKCVNDKYMLENEIGRGSFGEVWQVLDLTTKRHFAMKTLHRHGLAGGAFARIHIDTSVSEVVGEIAIMKKLRNEYVVRLVEVIDDPKAHKLYLIQELMEGPLLPDTLHSTPLAPEMCRRYFRDIIRGVHYLHAQGIVHRDIKPQNILISNGTAKIGDLGTAVFTGGHGGGRSKFQGTPAYTAPELNLPHEQRSHNFSIMPCIDLFAMGATLYCISVGHPPWMADTELGLADKIQHLEPRLSPQTDPHLRFLVLRLLEKDWTRRADMDAVVSDAWVTNEGSDPLFDDYHGEESEGDEADCEVLDVFRTSDASLPVNVRQLDLSVSGQSMPEEKNATAEVCKSATEGEPETETETDLSVLTVDYEWSSKPTTILNELESREPRVALQNPNQLPSIDTSSASDSEKSRLWKRQSFATLSLSVSDYMLESLSPTPGTGTVLRPLPLADMSTAAVRRRQKRLKSIQASRLLAEPERLQCGVAGARRYMPRQNITPTIEHHHTSLLSLSSESRNQNNNENYKESELDGDGDGDGDASCCGSEESNDSDYGIIHGENQELSDIFGALERANSNPGSNEVAVWDCVVCPDGSVSVKDSARGCVSPLPVDRKLRGGSVDVPTRLAHLQSTPPPANTTSNTTAPRSRTSTDADLRLLSGVRYGICQSQGGRPGMEDRSAVSSWSSPITDSAYSPSSISSDPNTMLFALFDGHGGDYAAEALKREISNTLKSALSEVHRGTNNIENANCVALRETCAKLDCMLLAQDFLRLRTRKEQGVGLVPLLQNYAGATGLILLLQAQRLQSPSRESVSTVLHIANVGDSRAVLCSRGETTQLTMDHKPIDAYETDRINKAGGHVANGRVHGALGVSRAFGDILYKHVESDILQVLSTHNGKPGDSDVLMWTENNLWNSQQAITSEPQIVSREILPEDEFIIAATDGLWDLLSNETVVNFVRFQLLAHGNLTLAAQQLLEVAQERVGAGGADNMSAVIIALNQEL